ncbi:DUF4266 domain-containing protein [Methylomicrobium album]|uniref:DUF4266 domain-containing protein n=2 Tax=Methylomicrobium TaxID=39773 RepID=H8GIY0_METAL|nr:DUF4266 domain-containing protein [Methylomicrobium album]EIC31487.1 hypothetical protein Metal_3846 [Methylomicrobium album BG8]
MMPSVRRTYAALAFFLAIGAAGCTEVAPWQRGNLAKPQMALEPYPLQSSFRGHIYGSREAASGVSASEGGGCGCY